MSDARTTLEVVLKTTGFTEGATAIKKVGDEATTTNAKLKTTTSTVDQVSKSTTSLGSKLKNAGSQFSGTITSVAALGSTVVNLSRQYQDLSDAQIRVDRGQLKIDKTNRILATAHRALNKLVGAGVTSGAQYEKALNDVKIAQDGVTLATTMHGEALEDQQRAYENFFLGLAPTILTAGSSITAMFKEMGGTKGIGGIAEKLKGLGGSFGGMSGLTAVLGPLALAAGAAAIAVIAYQNAAEKVAKANSAFEASKGVKTLKEELALLHKGFEELKLKPETNIVDFFSSLGPGGLQNTFVKMAEEAKIEITKTAAETEKLTKAREAYNTALKDPALKSHVTNTANAAKETLKLAEAEVKRLEAIEKTIPEMDKMSSSQKALNVAMGEKGTLLDTMTKPFTGKSVFNTMATDVDTLKAKFMEMSAEADRSKFWQLMSGGNKGAITKKTPIPLFDQPAIDPNEWFAGAFEAGSKGFSDFAKDSAEAAAKIKEDQTKAAADVKAAWLNALTEQTAGIQKVIDAYNKLHPKEKGFSGLAQEKQFTDATAQLQKLMSGVATKLGSPAYAQKFVTDFVTNAAKKMTPVAGQVFQPIIDYINQNQGVEATTWMSGFLRVLGTSNPTLAKTFTDMFYNSATKPAEEAATAAGAAFGTIDTGPMMTQMDKAKLSAEGMAIAMNKVPKKLVPNVTAKVVGTTQVNQLKQSINAVKSKIVTLTVKTNLQNQAARLMAGASANIPKRYGGPKQHGYMGTVKRPTSFLVGEGGRQEDVMIRPKGSAGPAGGGGGGDVQVNVYLDGDRIDQGMRYRINKDQGIFK